MVDEWVLQCCFNISIMSQRLVCKLHQTEQRFDGSSLFVYVLDEYNALCMCNTSRIFSSQLKKIPWIICLFCELCIKCISRFLSFDLSLMC